MWIHSSLGMRPGTNVLWLRRAACRPVASDERRRGVSRRITTLLSLGRSPVRVDHH